jgi:putative phosphoesterase
MEKFLADCDEVWHAGDIGNQELCDRLEKRYTFRAVYGNIDGTEIRKRFMEHLRFFCEGVDVWITHIGGYPGKYDRSVRDAIRKDPPMLFISGHSHILKVMYDKELKLLHINPGAAGKSGLHKKITAVRFVIAGAEIKELEVYDKERFVP